VVLDQIGTPVARALLREQAKAWPEAKVYLDRHAPLTPVDRLDVLSAVRGRGLERVPVRIR
jgi:hypothetical protein